jgi:translation initiation factor 5A
MVLKLINATEIRTGTILTIDKNHYTVKSYDISKTGKHGSSKVRFEAISLFDGKKKVMVVPGHERFEVPLIKKLKAQILSITGNTSSIMDLETFETIEAVLDSSEASGLKENDTVEYWDVEGKLIVKRKG